MLNLHPDQRQQILDLRFDIASILDDPLEVSVEYLYGMMDALDLLWGDSIDTDPEDYAHTNSRLADVMKAVQRYREDTDV